MTTTPEGTAQAVIYDCGAQPVSQPDTYILLCGDGGQVLTGLTWSNWGRPTAAATGQMWQNNCQPNCAAGTSIPYAATVTVAGLTGGSYTTMHIVAPKAPSSTTDFTLGSDGPALVQNN
ncbi:MULTISPECIES: hypothetical protein [unclassified Streptomyces]|uniref:hypothetical protein n=1 Tax=unclassified Streptomyces TaxID=2593676 RepID=UPI001BE525B7|nr:MULTISPECIES: hypothetical protein [unclassified Streptomyces]MBT2406547.1 hypothetical protein [Streptomyces sp. ISL-21]MBT2459804.1 hypothetical protein [Streptomyces sp. ISL-86]MBT2608885.1 hypothetical protein [Streptomyces sp. ISL-87]